MRNLIVSTLEYDVNISDLLLRRMRESSSGNCETFTVAKNTPDTVELSICNDTQFDDFLDAVSDLLLFDLSQFEIADMVKALPLTLDDQKIVLIEAIRYSKTAALRSSVRRSLKDHYQDSDSLVLEGFLRFRMRDTVRIWERCVDKAAEELLLRTERMELMGILGAFVRMRPARIKEVALILRPDGACSLTDDSDTHIDYPPDAYDSLVSLLISLSPRRITVYDLSDGICADLLTSIHRVFEDRVRIYRTTHT